MSDSHQGHVYRKACKSSQIVSTSTYAYIIVHTGSAHVKLSEIQVCIQLVQNIAKLLACAFEAACHLLSSDRSTPVDPLMRDRRHAAPGVVLILEVEEMLINRGDVMAFFLFVVVDEGEESLFSRAGPERNWRLLHRLARGSRAQPSFWLCADSIAPVVMGMDKNILQLWQVCGALRQLQFFI